MREPHAFQDPIAISGQEPDSVSQYEPDSVADPVPLAGYLPE